MDQQCVGKLETTVSKWIGFDKYGKYVYGLNSTKENVDIVVQSVFGGNALILGSYKKIYIPVCALGAEEYLGFVATCSNLGLKEFILFSTKNKTFEKYIARWRLIELSIAGVFINFWLLGANRTKFPRRYRYISTGA